MMSELKAQKTQGISFLERHGPGPCLVFLHGIGSNAVSFQAVFNQLPCTFHLLAWNAPGYGSSDSLVPAWPTAVNYAEALAKLLKSRNLGPVILIGHSLGTLIAASFAQVYPDQVSHLVLASCATGYGIPVGDEMPSAVAARITDLETLGAAEFARTRAPRLVHLPDDNPNVVKLVEGGMSKVNPDGYGQAVRMLANGTLNDTLRHVDVPCSFITGTNDQVTAPVQTLSAAEAWATSHDLPPRMEQITEAGHAVYIQQPDAFAATLLRLLTAATPKV